MNRKKIAYVCIILSILFFAGFMFEYNMYTSNKDTYEENEEAGQYETRPDERKEAEETIETQKIFTGICGGLFFLFAVIAVIGYITSKESSQAEPSSSPPEQTNTRPCPTCNKPMRLVKEYNRWYCDNCEEYKQQKQK